MTNQRWGFLPHPILFYFTGEVTKGIMRGYMLVILVERTGRVSKYCDKKRRCQGGVGRT